MPRASTSSILRAVALSAFVAFPLVAGQAPTTARLQCGTAASGPMQSICDNIVQPSDGSYKYPEDAKCVQEPIHGGYFCGYKGAACTAPGGQCDFGQCSSSETNVEGVCTGGLGDNCIDPSQGPQDSYCLGNLSCTGPDGTGGDGTCGGIGAACGYSGDFEPTSTGNSNSCVSGFCDPATLTCAPLPLGASQSYNRARRHSQLSRRGGLYCPAGQNACANSHNAGFECINILSNLERCGGCDSDTGGMDCTAIAHADAVGCVNGSCEIWLCTEGFEVAKDGTSCVAL